MAPLKGGPAHDALQGSAGGVGYCVDKVAQGEPRRHPDGQEFRVTAQQVAQDGGIDLDFGGGEGGVGGKEGAHLGGMPEAHIIPMASGTLHAQRAAVWLHDTSTKASGMKAL